jgi:A/G-specific adenine glycosylase
MTRQRLVRRLFAWHVGARRDLEIRQAVEPWHVLVAEVMSQQTGIDRVGPYWRRFIATWPTPAALADAPTPELLAAWAGLGYNRRALALREAARTIRVDHGGRVPRKVAALESLPGVGPYTARAIAATAFQVPVAPLDVNVRRVLGRVLGPMPAGRLQDAADAVVARTEPRRWLDAMTDLAATVCRPQPACPRCPLLDLCATRGPGDRPSRRRAAEPFPTTNRWLRGRVLKLARQAAPGTWTPLPTELGHHGREAVVRAATELAREGFLEVRGQAVRIRA